MWGSVQGVGGSMLDLFSLFIYDCAHDVFIYLEMMHSLLCSLFFLMMSDMRQAGLKGKKLTSWNVKGMGHPINRGRVFTHLKSLSADIVSLEETHIKHSEQWRLRCHLCLPDLVIILIRKFLPFKPTNIISDLNRCFILAYV